MREAAGELRNGAAAGDRLSLERPRKTGFGDYSTNAAMLLAPTLGVPPREVAERLGAALQARLGAQVERVEVAGPGFLNLFLSDAWYLAATGEVLAAGDRFGAGAQHERIQVEFVSANPTGPLTAASGRHAAFGDALARILELAGNEVEREYYFNDSGGQVLRLGRRSWPARAARSRPRTATRASTSPSWPRRSRAPPPAPPEELATAAVAIVMAGIRATLERYRVHFDRWYSERTLYEGEPSAWQRARAQLAAEDRSYRSDGALWLRTTALGDDKDRVLERSNGEPTYFAADVAYHWDKLDRGYDRLVNVLGADHHGYVARLKAAVAAVGADPARLEIPILQFVHVVDGGARASMSKRRGDFVTLEELIEEIGVDATRWFMLSRSGDSTVDLDLHAGARAVGGEPRLLRPVRARADRFRARQGGRGARGGRARRAARAARAGARRARAGEEAARVPGRGRRGRRPPRAASDRGLRARDRAGVHRVLPRLPRHRRRASCAGVVPALAQRGDAAGDRAGARICSA